MTPKSIAKPARHNPVGTISLSIAAVGFGAIEAAHWAWGGEGLLWSLGRAGFEAALIGGMADWFAVTALFHPVPNGRFALPHTDLIMRNRSKLTDGLVDMVENHLLSPASVKERLNELSVSQLVLTQLDSPSGRALAVDALQSLAGRFSGELEDEKLRQFLTDLLREQIRNADLAGHLGPWLKARVKAGDMRVIWTSLAGTLADKADDGTFDEFIGNALSAALENYKAESNWFTRKAVDVMINPDDGIVPVRSALSNLLREQSQQKTHPFNLKLDAVVKDYAQSLVDKDESALRTLRDLQERLASHSGLEKVVGHLLTDLRKLVQRRLESEPEEVGVMLENVIERGVAKLKADTEAQQKLDAWARSALQDLVTRYHSVIGATARDSIDRLQNEELVVQLESKVGHDLQYIRLNGAMVGALVGIAIAGGRWLLR